MGAGEGIDVGATEPVQQVGSGGGRTTPADLAAYQRVTGFHRLQGQPPAGQRLGIPVEDADAVPADAGGEMPGQLAEAAHQAGEPRCGRPEPGHDLVGAVDDVVADVVGVGAAAAGVLVVGGELGLDVALGRVAGQDCLADRLEVLRVHVQPVEVPVAHDRRRAAGLAIGPLDHGAEGGQVAVEPADHIQGLGLELGRPGQGLRLVPVGQRAGAAARVHALPPDSYRGWLCPLPMMPRSGDGPSQYK